MPEDTDAEYAGAPVESLLITAAANAGLITVVSPLEVAARFSRKREMSITKRPEGDSVPTSAQCLDVRSARQLRRAPAPAAQRWLAAPAETRPRSQDDPRAASRVHGVLLAQVRVE